MSEQAGVKQVVAVDDDAPEAKALRHRAHQYHTAKPENKRAAMDALYAAARAFRDEELAKDGS